MRQARIKGEGLSYYHFVSRIVDRRFIFGDAEKEYFVALMRKLEGFLGLRVVTYVVMCNHFHLLVEGPDEETQAGLDRDTLLKRMPLSLRRQRRADIDRDVRASRPERQRSNGRANPRALPQAHGRCFCLHERIEAAI